MNDQIFTNVFSKFKSDNAMWPSLVGAASFCFCYNHLRIMRIPFLIKVKASLFEGDIVQSDTADICVWDRG